MTPQEIATQYRHDHNHENGYIVIYREEVQAWSVDPLPESWKPGTVAIDPDGKVMTAVGGNDYDGAQAWEIFAGPEQPETDSPTQQVSTTNVCCLSGFAATREDDLEDLLDKALTPNSSQPNPPGSTLRAGPETTLGVTRGTPPCNSSCLPWYWGLTTTTSTALTTFPSLLWKLIQLTKALRATVLPS
jgi:hypothetical protein